MDALGNLYAVNFQKDGTIAIIAPGKSPEVFLQLPDGSMGNGIRFNSKNEMFVADFINHNVIKVDLKNRSAEVFVHDTRMNQPNDLAISNKGILFLSDPDWAKNTGQIWKVMPDGTLSLLETCMGTTNGLEVAPADDKLYVNESIQDLLVLK